MGQYYNPTLADDSGIISTLHAHVHSKSKRKEGQI